MSNQHGGGRASGMVQGSQGALPLVYRPMSDLSVRRDQFRRDLRKFGSWLRQFAHTKYERHVCDGLVSGQSLSIDGFEVLMELVARGGAEAEIRLEGLQREAITVRKHLPPALCVFEASELEQQANAPLDCAQLFAHKEKTATRWQAVVDFGMAQLHATRRLVESAIVHIGGLS